jgi:Papain-like cysteine protease AvrRpt2
MTLMKPALGLTLLLSFALQALATSVRQGGAPDERPAVWKTNPLRASFGKATHIVVGRVTGAAVYKRSGERVDELPDILGRRQYISLALHVEQTLDPAGAKLPASIEVRLEAEGLPVYPFIFGLTNGAKVFFLKMNLGDPSKYYYPADPTIFFTDVRRRDQMVLWVKQRVAQTPAPPEGAKAYYRVRGATPRVLQEGGYDCWAAAAAMMLSWRDQVDYTEAEAARLAGSDFVRLLEAKGHGIEASAKGEFLKRVGLTAEAPKTFTARGLRELLQEHGPLWVTVNQGDDNDPYFVLPHARVIVAIDGDGTPEGTFVTYLDPAGFAENLRVSLQQFTETFETIARGDLIKVREAAPERQLVQPFRPQILHF